jgi:hypothetical protein
MIKTNRAVRYFYQGRELRAARARAGWEDTRLLAPIAEARLLLAATPAILDTERLAALGLALRALVCLEVRRVAVAERGALSYVPAHVVKGTDVARVAVQSQSGVVFPIVLGAPAQVRRAPCSHRVSL